jgi:long-chain fatty acid transport protein
MKKFLLIGAATLIVSNSTFAGDYLTNTNQHAAFLRMAARGASIDVDGVYSNPAGLAFLQKDGFHLSLTGQSAYQTREIAATTGLWTLDGKETTQNYKGTLKSTRTIAFFPAKLNLSIVIIISIFFV